MVILRDGISHEELLMKDQKNSSSQNQTHLAFCPWTQAVPLLQQLKINISNAEESVSVYSEPVYS